MTIHTKKNPNAALATYSFNGDTDTGITSTAANQVDVVVGGEIVYTFNSTTLSPKLVSATAVTGGAGSAGVFASWVNPEAGTILITRAIFNVTTVATAAATINIGTTATSATTASDTLIDGLDVNAATGIFDNSVNGGTNGKGSQTLASGKWVTVAEATGDVNGLVGNLYLEYVVL